MTAPTSDRIVLEDVSRFYGEVLGVNRVTLTIGPGITSLVGPNGAGKTTLMNLMTGLVRPSRGRLSLLGISPRQPQRLFRHVGYASQFDAFPRGLTGEQFVTAFLRLAGHRRADCRALAAAAIEEVGLTEAAHRPVAAYSKGMRQRIRLAQAIAHDPRVLILDEPLNGLDPLIRAQTLARFRQYADEGRLVVVSSHVLHEVDRMSDQVVLLSGGYVVAEGSIGEVRSDLEPERPLQIRIQCDRPRWLAQRAFDVPGVLSAHLAGEREVVLQTRQVDALCRRLNDWAVQGLDIQAIQPVDTDVQSVYQYLMGPAEESAP